MGGLREHTIISNPTTGASSSTREQIQVKTQANKGIRRRGGGDDDEKKEYLTRAMLSINNNKIENNGLFRGTD